MPAIRRRDTPAPKRGKKIYDTTSEEDRTSAPKRAKKINDTTSDEDRTCPSCRTVLSRSEDLPRHMDIHDPDTAEQFRCQVGECIKAYRQLSNLYTHQRKKHGIVHKRASSNSQGANAYSRNKIPSHLVRSVEVDGVEAISSVAQQFGVFPVAAYGNYLNNAPPAWAGYPFNNFQNNNTGHIMNSIPQATGYCNPTPAHIEVKDEQTWEGYYRYGNFPIPSAVNILDENALPELSPSNSWDSESSTESCPSTPSTAFNNNVNIELAPVPSFDYDNVCPQLITPYSVHDATPCPEVEPLSYQDNMYVPQYANAALPQGVPLLGPAALQQQTPIYGYDANYSAASAYQPTYANMYQPVHEEFEPVPDVPAYDAELQSGATGPLIEPEMINFFDFTFNYSQPTLDVSSWANYLGF